MTTPQNTKAMMNALKRTRADIASLADFIDCELEKLDESKVTWGTLNALEYTIEHLTETLVSISCVNQPEIQRSLDELQM